MTTATVTKSEASRTRTKSFLYRTSIEWLENRAGMARSEGKPEMRVSSPPEFKGEAGVWTPEDLFVSAVESCTMATFLAFAHRKALPLVSYRSEAEGVLEFVDGRLKFTRVVVRPAIVVEEEGALPLAQELVSDAERHCLVANSLLTEVKVEATVTTR